MRYAHGCTFALLLGSLVGCSSLPIQGRWVRTGGATEIGPKLPSGTLVLLGGRRALVEPNGYVRQEYVVTPEPLCGLIAVPTPLGDRVIGYGKHTVYRFDDPLGEPIALTTTPESTEIAGIAPGPGTVFVWPTNSNTSPMGLRFTSPYLGQNQRGPCSAAESRPLRQPISIHVLSRERKPLDEWPSLLIRDVAFRSTSDGVVFFAKAGMAITEDGGKTFQPAKPVDPDKTRQLQRLERRGDELFLVGSWHDNVRPIGNARVDIDQNEVGAFRPEPEERDPTLAWITATHVDPMQIYLQGSTDPRGNVIVAHQVGQVINLARVDPETGKIIEFVRHSLTPAPPTNPYVVLGYDSCRVALLPNRGVLVCRSGVHGLPVDGPLKPTPIPTFNPPNGHLDFLFRPGGGFAHTSACTPQEQSKDHHQFCVSGTGASFQTISVPSSNNAIQNGLSVLDDGRLVYLDEMKGEKRPGAMSFVIIDKRGALHPLVPIEPPNYIGENVSGNIELGSDGVLRALTHSSRGAGRIQQPLRGTPSWNEPDFSYGQLHHGRGFMINRPRMSISKDAGASWLDIGSYPTENLPPTTDTPMTAEMGIKFGSWLRVGWNPGREFTPPPPVAPASYVIENEPVVPAKPRQLICKSQQEIGPAPGLWGEATRNAFFDRAHGESSQTEPWKTVSSGVFRGRFAARFEQIARDMQTATHWRLAVLDLHNPTGPIIKWSGGAPAGMSPHAYLASVQQVANRAFFTIVEQSNEQWFTNHLSLSSSRAQPHFARIRKDSALVRVSVAMASNDADPIYIADDGQVFRWDMNGKPPRQIATSQVGPEVVFLGEPRRDEVPVIIKGASWASMNWLRGNLETELGGYPVEQWRHAPITLRDELPACEKNSTGTLFTGVPLPQPVIIKLNETQIGRTVALHGVDNFVGPDAVYVDLRVGDRVACIERIDMQVSTNDSEVTGRVTRFLTTNLTDGSGHAIEAGPGAMIQKIECSLATPRSSR